MPLTELSDRLAGGEAVLVTVVATEGSAPREAGTWMAVWPDAMVGTIGGGQVELEAIARAREHLAARAPTDPAPRRVALGPSLGQCCGGVMYLRYERLVEADAPRLLALESSLRRPVALFGGGHVGRALIRVLAPLPFSVTWVDSRDEIFPADVPAWVRCEHSDPVQAAVDDLVAGSRVLIMSFSHAEDLDVVAACLRRLRTRDDLPFIGLIGSRTKWATFRHRLLARGFAEPELQRITCPIGVPGVIGKEPEVIAVAVAAQLLQHRLL